jgi:hypothetical protein
MTAVVRAPRANWTDVLSSRKANSLIGIVGETDADNRRWAHRRNSATSATLIGGEIGDPVPCVILDTSSTGARVKPHFARGARLQNLKDLPEKFTLFYTLDRVAIDCVLAWRRDGEIGLKFTSPARSIPKPAPRPKIGPTAKK